MQGGKVVKSVAPILNFGAFQYRFYIDGTLQIGDLILDPRSGYHLVGDEFHARYIYPVYYMDTIWKNNNGFYFEGNLDLCKNGGDLVYAPATNTIFQVVGKASLCSRIFPCSGCGRRFFCDFVDSVERFTEEDYRRFLWG